MSHKRAGPQPINAAVCLTFLVCKEPKMKCRARTTQLSGPNSGVFRSLLHLVRARFWSSLSAVATSTCVWNIRPGKETRFGKSVFLHQKCYGPQNVFREAFFVSRQLKVAETNGRADGNQKKASLGQENTVSSTFCGNKSILILDICVLRYGTSSTHRFETLRTVEVCLY